MDTNLLVYATMPALDEHGPARRWLVTGTAPLTTNDRGFARFDRLTWRDPHAESW